MEQYTALTENVEAKLDEADRMSEATTECYTADEVLGRVKKCIKNFVSCLFSKQT